MFDSADPVEAAEMARTLREAQRTLDMLLAMWIQAQNAPRPSKLTALELGKWALDYADKLERGE